MVARNFIDDRPSDLHWEFPSFPKSRVNIYRLMFYTSLPDYQYDQACDISSEYFFPLR